FKPISKEKLTSYGKGLTVLESHQCPYSPNGIKAIRRMAEIADIPLKVLHLTNFEDAQKNGVYPYGPFCVLLNGKVISYYPGDVSEVRKALVELSKQATN
ncbi:MAG: hypothetical protein AB1457_18945, partial [Chloroflexota bacterium]